MSKTFRSKVEKVVSGDCVGVDCIFVGGLEGLE
jgi:hypothetical protein